MASFGGVAKFLAIALLWCDWLKKRVVSALNMGGQLSLNFQMMSSGMLIVGKLMAGLLRKFMKNIGVGRLTQSKIKWFVMTTEQVKMMTRTKLKTEIWRRIIENHRLKTTVNKKQVEAVLNAMIEVVTETVSRGEVVRLKNFATFTPKIVKAREFKTYYQNSENKTYLVPEHQTVDITATDWLKKRVREGWGKR